MIEVQVPEMMEAGAHFGHQTKRWNPKMRQYIYGARSGVHIINLQRTKGLANEALQQLNDYVAKGKQVLFVGTKPQAREVIKEEANRAKMHYVNQRWMGGTLTNFKTIKKSIDRLIDLETRRENDDFKGYNKRELLEVDRTIAKLEASLGGIKKLNRQPDVVFIVDPKHERIAVLEAKKLGLPIVAITDSNCDPEPIDLVIPANDDAILSIQYFTTKVADACLEGLERREEIVKQEANESKKQSGNKKPERKKRVAKGTEEDGKTKTAYVGRTANPEFEGDADQGFSAKADTKEPEAPSIKTEEGEEEKGKEKGDSVAAAS